MRHGQLRPQAPAKEVAAWAEVQRKTLREDREGNPAFVRAIQAMNVAPGRVRGA